MVVNDFIAVLLGSRILVNRGDVPTRMRRERIEIGWAAGITSETSE